MSHQMPSVSHHLQSMRCEVPGVRCDAHIISRQCVEQGGRWQISSEGGEWLEERCLQGVPVEGHTHLHAWAGRVVVADNREVGT